MKNLFVSLSLLYMLTCCSQEKDATKAPVEEVSKSIFIADPTIFYNNGTYYLYGTTTGNVANGEGFLVYTSSDLQKWSEPKGAQNGLALKKGDSYGDKGFWAPQILEYNKKVLHDLYG